MNDPDNFFVGDYGFAFMCCLFVWLRGSVWVSE